MGLSVDDESDRTLYLDVVQEMRNRATADFVFDVKKLDRAVDDGPDSLVAARFLIAQCRPLAAQLFARAVKGGRWQKEGLDYWFPSEFYEKLTDDGPVGKGRIPRPLRKRGYWRDLPIDDWKQWSDDNAGSGALWAEPRLVTLRSSKATLLDELATHQ